MNGALKKTDKPGQANNQSQLPARAQRRGQAVKPDAEAEARLREAQAGARALTPQQRAAIIIALLGPNYAGPIIEKIEDRHLKAFYQSYESLARIPREVLFATIAEFLSELKSLSGTIKGGREEAKELSAKLFDSERSARIFGTDFHAKPKADIWLRLARETPEDLARYFAGQRVQVVSIAVAQLPKELAGEVLAALPDEKTPDIVRRLSKPIKVDDATLKALGDVMETEYFADDTPSERSENPLATVSSILSVLPGEKRESILNYLAQQQPGEAERIRETMLTFETLPTRISRTAVPVIFRQMDQDELLKALKLAATNAPETLEFFYANVSRRMVEQYKEQVEAMGQIRKKDAEKAQAAMMSLIARLQADGEIELVSATVEAEDDDDEEKI